MRHLTFFLILSYGACSSLPPSTQDSVLTVEEEPKPVPRFVANEQGFGPVLLGVNREIITQSLPLDLRLVTGASAPPGLGGEAVFLTDTNDNPLFVIGFVHNEVAWIFAENPSSQVGTKEGVGFESSFAFARQTLGEENKAKLPGDASEYFHFQSLRQVALGFDSSPPKADSRVSRILLFDPALLPGAIVSFEGIVLPMSRVVFASNQVRREAIFQNTTSSLPVGTLVEGEGVRDASGVLTLSRFFAKDPFGKQVVSREFREKILNDPGFLSYIALLTVRNKVSSYSIEALPEEKSALLILQQAQKEGYAKIEFSDENTNTPIPEEKAKNTLKISEANFTLSKQEFLTGVTLHK